MWRYLRDLFATPPPQVIEVAERPEEFRSAQPPDWLVRWQGEIEPGAGGFAGRILLWEHAIAPVAEAVYPTYRSRPAPLQKVDLTDVAANRVWSVLREAFRERWLSVREESIDGIPIQIAVFRREPERGILARCNLGDALFLTYGRGLTHQTWSAWADAEVSAGRSVAPVFRLGMVLLELSMQSADQRDASAIRPCNLWEERHG